MAGTYKGFRELDCWKEGTVLRRSVSTLVKNFPAEEKFLLSAQLTRASRSVTANIAEGYGRYTYTDTRSFFIIARGSLTETIEHLTVSLDEQYILPDQFEELERQCELVFKLINGYIAYLDRSKKAQRTSPNS